MVELAQDIIVTSVAASAAVVLARRVVGAVRPGKGKGGQQPACPSCASGAGACAKPSHQQAAKPPDTQPLTLIR